MASLLFLSDGDFFIGRGTKGDILCTNIPSYSLILFYANNCPHCKALDPVFRKLPGTIQGCQFGMVNVNNSPTTIQMSKKTIAPITYVPMIILYVNGRPFMVYRGPHDIENLRRFIVEVAQKLQTKQKFSSENVKEDVRGRIPDFTIGHPVFGDDNVTYLEFNDAYQNQQR